MSAATEQLLRDLGRFQEDNRRWRRLFFLTSAALVLLLPVSVLQFAGAFIILRSLHETRAAVQEEREEVSKMLAEIRDARGEMAARAQAYEEQIALLNMERQRLHELGRAATYAIRKKEALDRRRETLDPEQWLEEVRRMKAIEEVLSHDLELRRQVLELLKQRKGQQPTEKAIQQSMAPVKDPHECEHERSLLCPVALPKEPTK
jgi:hypothetical protein